MVVAGAADHFRVRRARPRQKYQVADRLRFLGRKKVRALPAALFERRLPHRFFDHDGLLGRADRAVIKCFSGENVADRFAHIRRAFDERRHVPRANAVSRLARAVRGAHQSSAARRQDHAHVPVTHQLPRSGKSSVLHAADQPFRAPRG